MMLVDQFPPLPTNAAINGRMCRLSAQASLAVHKQHLVSSVLLRQFAASIGQGGAPQVYSFNLECPQAKLRGRGLETCGEAPITDFVKFASQSLERVWWRVENDAAATFGAVRDGSALKPEHLSWLRDLLAVHHARSIQYYAVFEDNRERVRHAAWKFWRQYPALLDAIATSRLQLPAGRAESRNRAVEDLHEPFSKLIEDGALFRVMMESRYRRTRHWFRAHGVEILTPSSGEFIVGDIPALTVRRGLPSAGVNGGVGYGFATAIVLPIAPDRLVRIVDGPSRYLTIDQAEVDELNAWQVRGAFSHVYLRPGSGLEGFIRTVDRPRPSAGVYRELFQLSESMRRR